MIKILILFSLAFSPFLILSQSINGSKEITDTLKITSNRQSSPSNKDVIVTKTDTNENISTEVQLEVNSIKSNKKSTPSNKKMEVVESNESDSKTKTDIKFENKSIRKNKKTSSSNVKTEFKIEDSRD